MPSGDFGKIAASAVRPLELREETARLLRLDSVPGPFQFGQLREVNSGNTGAGDVSHTLCHVAGGGDIEVWKLLGQSAQDPLRKWKRAAHLLL